MLYGRWTIFYFDPAKKDAMVSHLAPQLDVMTKEVAGAVQARVVQVVPVDHKRYKGLGLRCYSY